MKERIVITAIGGVAPIGGTAAEIMAGLASGRKGIDHIRSFDAGGLPLTAAAEVPGLRLSAGVEKKRVLLDRAAEDLFAGNATWHRYRPNDRIFILGSGVDYLDLDSFVQEGAWTDWTAHVRNSYAIAQDFAAQHDFQGGVHVNVSACVASNQALGLGYRLLQKEENKVVIAGGVDSMIDPLGYIGFYKLGALTRWEGPVAESCRPFDKQRCGVVLGEGAALYQLQRLSEADPAIVLGEVVGFGSSMDAYLITDPLPDGSELARACLEAIEDAGISPAEIDCVHLHGTGTQKNGPAEARALQRVFGERAGAIPVFGFKGQIGHLIGACGAVEILAVLYSLARQQVPVTVNSTQPDPAVPLNVIRDRPLPAKINHVLKLNAAFGGQNAALVFRRFCHG
jgi:3-oxoacyl-[acyl-carrier-protein] synthase II